ncbi:MAG: hypothetical protein ACPL06_02930 [Candidatus Anstonellales archaeon]
MTCTTFTPEMLNMDFVYTAMAIGTASSAIAISIVYMIGKITNNPRLDVWAHDELPQLFFSALFAIFILGFLNIGMMYKVSALSELTNFTVQNGEMCLYDFADAYLDDMAMYVHNTMRITRIYTMMAGFISAIWKYQCTSVWCFLASQGVGLNPDAWVSLISAVLNAQAQTSSLALLSILAQKYLLRSFISGGFLLIIPLGLVLRSVPFARRVGGILLAIGAGFIVFFPILLVVEGLVFRPEMWGYGNQENIDYLTSEGGLNIDETDPYFKGGLEWNILLFGQFDYFFEEDDGRIFLCKNLGPPWSNPACSVSLDRLLAYGGISFLISSFLLSLNFIGTSAGIIALGKFLGEEIEIARFLRMV